MADEASLEDRLESVFGHLGDMSPEELRQHVIKIRAERRLIKMKRKDKKSEVVKSDTAKVRMRKMLSGLSAEEIAKFLSGVK